MSGDKELVVGSVEGSGSISDFSIIDKDPSQITREAKEAIHIRRLDPNLN